VCGGGGGRRGRGEVFERKKAVPWPVSSRLRGTDLRFVVDRVTLGQLFLRVFRFSLPVPSHQCSVHIHPSPTLHRSLNKTSNNNRNNNSNNKNFSSHSDNTTKIRIIWKSPGSLRARRSENRISIYCTILYLLYLLLHVSALNLGLPQRSTTIFDLYSVNAGEEYFA
jgi:hypothetical protein